MIPGRKCGVFIVEDSFEPIIHDDVVLWADVPGVEISD